MTPKIVLHAPEDGPGVGLSEFQTPSSKNSENQIDAYYTGFGNPEITPVARIKTRSNVLSLKSFLNASPLSPRQRVQERLRRHSASFRTHSEKPEAENNLVPANGEVENKNRKRHISEGDVKQILAKKPDLGRLNYKRYPIHDEGYHKCDGHQLHLRKKFINDTIISHTNLQYEIRSALQDALPEITPGKTKSSSTELFWRPMVAEVAHSKFIKKTKKLNQNQIKLNRNKFKTESKLIQNYIKTKSKLIQNYIKTNSKLNQNQFETKSKLNQNQFKTKSKLNQN